MTSRRLTVLATVAATACTGLVTLGSTAAADPAPSSLKLMAPRHATAYVFHKRAFLDFSVGIEAVAQNFELWSHRANFHSPITTELRRGATDTDLPAGLMTDFTGLPKFFDVSIADSTGKVVLHRRPTVCLDGSEIRVVPDGAAHSPYPPYGCPYNIFTKGSVQGIAAGWATEIPVLGYRSAKLAKGTYTVTTKIASTYRSLFGISAPDATGTTSLTVKKIRCDKGCGPVPVPVGGSGATSSSANVHPAPTLKPSEHLAHAPTTGPEPDLEALPAWGIQVSKGGNYLQFSATVWNGGDSPMVVQGFHTNRRHVLKSYQYFYDTDGNQVGYVRAGHMDWDAAPTHHHWHFADFAQYRLLDANKDGVVRSQKDGFCLANTDAIDYTIPGANWNPDNTDLQTDCGDLDSPSVTEVLAAGSGDTYEQFRAGQSFSLKNLKNGIYYVSIEANPNNVLTEQSMTNNTALRKVRIGGTPDHRTVYVYPKGDVTG
jgi:hypothetical protein